MRPLPGARLTLINPGPTAPYSGMLPGFVAGHYDRDALDIDLVRLARFANARLIAGAAVHLDLAAKEVHVPGRPPVAYDLCSLDIGITSAMPGLPGFAEFGVPAKPLGPFSQRWAAYLAGSGPARVAVLGAGVAGVELALAMAYALRAAGRTGQAGQGGGAVHLLDRSQALSGVDPGSRDRLRRALAEFDVTLHEHSEVVRISAGAVHLADGTEIAADFVTGAAGAQPQAWLAQSGLETEAGYVTVDTQLQTSDPAVFAVGDCAHMAFDPRPKAGVYAVRQAPFLKDNLIAALTGGRMRAYAPQRDYLKLISLGGKSAVGQRFGRSFAGPVMWRWKDRIDQRFMSRFRDLPVMAPPAIPAVRAMGMQEALGDKPLCGGCGAKVGRQTLRAALARADGANVGGAREDIEMLPGDDAALLRVGGARQVVTTDHLRAFVSDPVRMTRITAVHALGDIWAMGGAPQAATLTLILPPLAPELQARTLYEITQTATQVLREAGAEIVGGHTTVGSELTIGFTLTGLCAQEPVTLAGGRSGDVLILTKPLGSGVLMAAEMAGQARGAWVEAAYGLMQRGQGAAAAVLAPVAHAMTDVTGFGLAGHLQGICEASGLGAQLELDAVPLMEGAAELSGLGVRSSLFEANRAITPELPTGGLVDLLYDPQTSGGLLAAVPAAQAEAVLAELCAQEVPAARIGVLTAGSGGLGRITLG